MQTRVLLVDDEPMLLELGREILESDGFEVEVADDGAGALALFKAGRPFDLVILDFHMPGLNGVEVAEQIHALAPVCPVLLVTGSEPRRDALDQPHLGYLLKPYTFATLKQAVRDILGGTGR
ncbi:MAG: two-component system response regulator [Alphaproteobacteria bacterium CG_4_10_14_0_2_um_filter_63_37]|nr:MAG: hypothetical protein AUJ55_10990 [Proteobacteria bacterium CG1_02_64_396]PJA25736.1 MAG: two-component system response regulator [Alphaproteobacteria bacterium CG_4_10_14_0_2_um_filter_63_37]